MKLSLKKKLGHVHVRGGRLLRVTQAHAVSTDSQPKEIDKFHYHTEAPKKQRFMPGEKWVNCAPGDLAMEITRVKDGGLVGHTYLSGRAIQLVRYTPIGHGFFEDATGYRVVPSLSSDAIEAAGALHISLQRAYTSGADIIALQHDLASDDEMHLYANALIMTWEAHQRAEEVHQPPHLIAMLGNAKTRETLLLHRQPERHATPEAVTPFQVGLLVSTLPEGRWIDPRTAS